MVDPEPLSPHSRKLEQPLDGAQSAENHFFHQLDRLGSAALRPGRLDELGYERLEREGIHPQFGGGSSLQDYHDFVDPSFHFLDGFEARDESCHASLIHFLVPTSGGDASHLKDGADVAM